MTHNQFIKLKVGDKIRVKRNLIDYHNYSGLIFWPRMSKYMGKTMFIKGIEKHHIRLYAEESFHLYSVGMIDLPLKFGR